MCTATYNRLIYILIKQAVLIVEILEYQSNVENGKAAIDFFLNDLGDANGATERRSKTLWTLDLFEDSDRVVFVPNLQLSSPPLQWDKDRAHLNIGRGSQKVAKKGSTNADWVDIEICILRFKDVKTDLLITLSMPHVEKKLDGGMVRGLWTEEYSNEFKQILEYFNIKDWSLFGEPEPVEESEPFLPYDFDDDDGEESDDNF